MPRAVSNKVYRTFVKGLITEASPLTYPENASIDEDNCVIFRKGDRSRRLGIDFDPNSSESAYAIPQNVFTGVATNEYRWEAVGNQVDMNFLVHQVGLSLFFYDMDAVPLSAGFKGFSIDLTPYVVPGNQTPNASIVSMAGGYGFLFVVGKQINPVMLTYDLGRDAMTVTPIYIQTRDFEGINDSLANDAEPTTLTPAHNYNLLNQGWFNPTNDGTGAAVTYFDDFGGQKTYAQPTSTTSGASTTDPIALYFTKFARYPGNNKQWWVAKQTSSSAGPPAYNVGDFNPALLSTFFFGSALAPRGHYIVNPFYIDRSAVSGIAGLPVISTLNRPEAVSFFAGRVWYGVGSTVYYSQVLSESGQEAGFCYQQADPTSEILSALVASDGGVIPIPQMARCVALVPLGFGVVVFATNGIWYISGTLSGFGATSVTVSKISSVGTDAPLSICEANAGVAGQSLVASLMFWSKIGIRQISQNSSVFGVTGTFQQALVSEMTIQTLCNQINDFNRQTIKGQYDPATNVVQWLFKDTSNTITTPYLYDRILNYDLTLGAFYPWTVSSSGGQPYITGFFTTPTLNIVEGSTDIRNNFFKYLCATPAFQNTQYAWSFGYFYNNNFSDWQTFDPLKIGQAYTSYMDTGFEILEDAMRRKATTWVYAYFRQTEQQYVELPSGDFNLNNPSSCYFQAKWDWSNSPISSKWSTLTQAYRLRLLPVLDTTNGLDVDSGFAVVSSKMKVRGNGRAIQFRFQESGIGTDFDLLGWAVEYTGETTP